MSIRCRTEIICTCQRCFFFPTNLPLLNSIQEEMPTELWRNCNQHTVEELDLSRQGVDTAIHYSDPFPMKCLYFQLILEQL